MAAPMKISVSLLSRTISRECLRLSRPVTGQLTCCRKLNTDITSIHQEDKIVKVTPKNKTRAQKISKAMKAYLEKATSQEKVLNEFRQEYDLGRRHLANIMGKDPDSFDHNDVKKAIRYLLPSGLFERKARPVMPLPEDVLPLQSVAQFGSDGRPFHFLFYTSKPHYYEILYEITQRLEHLKDLEAEMYKAGKTSEVYANKLTFIDSDLVEFSEFKKIVGEEITEEMFNDFVKMIARLAEHPLNFKEEEYIMKFRRKKVKIVTLDKRIVAREDGGVQIAVGKGKRKDAIAEVKVSLPGTGKFSVNGKSILYFSIIYREQIMSPLILTNTLMEVDIDAKVQGGGPTGQSGAIRLALSKALLSFVDQETAERMRQAGLLTIDPRVTERKKPHKRGARKGWTWKHR